MKMTLPKWFRSALATLAAGLAPVSAQALQITIQGQTLSSAGPSDTCIHIAGTYPGVRVENSEATKKSRICQQSKDSNLLVLRTAERSQSNSSTTSRQAPMAL